jgi:hypothetical protein
MPAHERYADCERPRHERCPLCPQCWRDAGAEGRALLLSLYTPGQHATGLCKRGWMRALGQVIAVIKQRQGRE